MHRFVEIGSLRERVEIVEAPSGPPHRRVGRLRHANGENVPIDIETLERLMDTARQAGAVAVEAPGRTGGATGWLFARRRAGGGLHRS